MEEQRVTCRRSGKNVPESRARGKTVSRQKQESSRNCTPVSHSAQPGEPQEKVRAGTRFPALRRRGAPGVGATRLGRRARGAASPARRRPSSPPSSAGKGGGRRPGRGGRSRSPAAAADVAAADAVEESTRARSLRGGSEPGPGRGRAGGTESRWTRKATKAEPLPRPRSPSRRPAASPADLGRGSWEGPQKGGVSAEFSLLTCNLGTRCLGMRRDLQRRPEFSAPRANTSPGDHRLEPPGSDTRCWARTPGPSPGSCRVSLRRRPRRWEGQREE